MTIMNTHPVFIANIDARKDSNETFYLPRAIEDIMIVEKRLQVVVCLTRLEVVFGAPCGAVVGSKAFAREEIDRLVNVLSIRRDGSRLSARLQLMAEGTVKTSPTRATRPVKITNATRGMIYG